MSQFNINNIDFSNITILVIGDLMLDRYLRGDCSRISPEAPVPIVHIKKTEERPGGAGNVALNLAALGAKVILQGVVGDDEPGEKLQKQLTSVGVVCQLQCVEAVPTITKLRVMSRHQQLVRLDFEEKLHGLNSEQLFESYEQALKSVDAVILSDYGKGTLSRAKALIALAKGKKVPVFVDPKSKDFSDYFGATCITPNLKEFEAVVGVCQSEHDLTKKGRALVEANELDAILVTRGEHGMTLLQSAQEEVHIPTQAQEVFDVTGAGDTVIAVLAAAVAGGYDLVTAMKLANTAAGITVAKLGSATVTPPELRRALQSQRADDSGVLNLEQLLLAVEDARAHGEKVIMTNGCFDILHAGHVQYLQQAKKLGQRLIIAVNDDDSVKRLKGESRPINNVEKRMAVLSGLTAVDWVVPFSEDTPEVLIKAILPDVLVKGGDYNIEEIVGSDIVLKNGGEVESLDFVEGYSTTAVINEIKGQ